MRADSDETGEDMGVAFKARLRDATDHVFLALVSRRTRSRECPRALARPLASGPAKQFNHPSASVL